MRCIVLKCDVQRCHETSKNQNNGHEYVPKSLVCVLRVDDHGLDFISLGHTFVFFIFLVNLPHQVRDILIAHEFVVLKLLGKLSCFFVKCCIAFVEKFRIGLGKITYRALIIFDVS